MEELYTLEQLSLREIKAIRKGLEFIKINGIDAMFIGALQIKIDKQIQQLEDHIQNKE